MYTWRIASCLVIALACAAPFAAQGVKRKPQLAAVCPDPTVKCRTTYTFAPNALPFRIPRNAFIYESEFFYAVILKTNPAQNGENCEAFIPEDERLQAQRLFPRHKVFTSRCYEPGLNFYTNVKSEALFMAVYAGRTRSSSAAVLRAVRASGQFPGAQLRRMQTGINGT